MSDGGTMTRVAAIREKCANPAYLLWPDFSAIKHDLQHLLRLVELAAAMPSPEEDCNDGWMVCRACHNTAPIMEFTHAPDCPWAVWRAAYEEVSG